MSAKDKAIKEYSAKRIKALSDKDHLRKRPALTFGRETGSTTNPFSSQKTVAIREIVDNSVGEALLGYANLIRIELNSKDQSFTVEDNGRGLPVDNGLTSTGEKASGIYLCLGVIKASGNFDTEDFSPSTHGVGASSTVKMSEKTIIEVYRNNKIYELDFLDGEPGLFNKQGQFEPITDLTTIKTSKDNRTADDKKRFPTGTKVHIKLDPNAFPSKYPFNADDLRERIKDCVCLVPNLSIELSVINEDGTKTEESFKNETGILQLLGTQHTLPPLIEPIHISTEKVYSENEKEKRVVIDLAFTWVNNFELNMKSYTNTILNRLGGVHEKAFEKAITSSFNDKLMSMKGMLGKNDPQPNFQDYSEGLCCVLAIKAQGPEFNGQAKEELSGSELGKAIQKAISEELSSKLEDRKLFNSIKIVGDKVVNAAKAKQAAKERLQNKRKAQELKNSNDMPAKLLDCEITHEEFSELYITEGDSAKSALKSVRNSYNQALLPIRGKIINVHKASMKKILDNKEVQDIIMSLEAEMGENFNVEDCRYQRIFIAADNDVDGNAIACLLVTLLWRLFPKIITEGKLYKIETPLFVVRVGKKRYYAYNDEEMSQLLKRLGDVKKDIARNKGLGEVEEEILFETGMNPDTRRVIQITANDVKAAEEMLEITMGTDPQLRRDWIAENPMEYVEE